MATALYLVNLKIYFMDLLMPGWKLIMWTVVNVAVIILIIIVFTKFIKKFFKK